MRLDFAHFTIKMTGTVSWPPFDEMRERLIGLNVSVQGLDDLQAFELYKTVMQEQPLNGGS